MFFPDKTHFPEVLELQTVLSSSGISLKNWGDMITKVAMNAPDCKQAVVNFHYPPMFLEILDRVSSVITNRMGYQKQDSAGIESIFRAIEYYAPQTSDSDYIRDNYIKIVERLGRCTTVFSIKEQCEEIMFYGKMQDSDSYTSDLANGKMIMYSPLVLLNFYLTVMKIIIILIESEKFRREFSEVGIGRILESNSLLSCIVNTFYTKITKVRLENTNYKDIDNLVVRMAAIIKHMEGRKFEGSNLHVFTQHCIDVSKEHIRNNSWLSLLEKPTIELLGHAKDYSTGPGGWTIDAGMPDNYILSVIDSPDVLRAYSHPDFPKVRHGVDLIRALAFPTQKAIVAKYVDSFVTKGSDHLPLSVRLELR